MAKEGKEVVEIDPSMDSSAALVLIALIARFLVAVSRQEHALVLEVDRRLQVRDAHDAAWPFRPGPRRRGREPLVHGDGVFPSGLEFAADQQVRAVGGKGRLHPGIDVMRPAAASSAGTGRGKASRIVAAPSSEAALTSRSRRCGARATE